MKKNNIKVVFFDYGGTLDSNGIAWKERFYSVYLENGLNIPFDEFVPAFYAADDSLVEEGLTTQNLTETVFEQTRLVFSNLGIIDKDHTISAVANTFLQKSKEQIRENIPCLKRLSASFRLGIISNNYGNIEAISRETGLSNLMDVMVDSRVAGHEKPEPEIFLHALEKAGAQPHEAVMVGDNVKRDIKGAENTGMQPILIMHQGSAFKDISCPVIHKIPEIERLLT